LAWFVFVVSCCAWPVVGRAGDTAAYDPFESRAFEFEPPDFDPFEIQQVAPIEIQQVAHIEQLPQQKEPRLQKLPAVKLADPFDEVTCPAPSGRGTSSRRNYVPPADAMRVKVASKPKPTTSRRTYPQTAQLELPSPGSQDEAEGYAASAREWTPKPLDELTINIAQPAGVTPRDYAVDRPQQHWECDATTTRCWPMLTYQWAATCLCHQPLYFEEINLERYGYGCGRCLQPAASAAHFFGTVPILPYCMAVNCPGECNYTLGQYRPGSCAPWRTSCPGPSCYGGLAEAGTIVGLVLLIP